MRRCDWVGTILDHLNERLMGLAKHALQWALLDVAAQTLTGGSATTGAIGLVWLAITYELVERLSGRPTPRRAA